MRFRKWVLTDRQKRILLTIGLVVGALFAIGLVPPVFFAFFFMAIAYGIFKLTMRIRRARTETRTY